MLICALLATMPKFIMRRNSHAVTTERVKDLIDVYYKITRLLMGWAMRFESLQAMKRGVQGDIEIAKRITPRAPATSDGDSCFYSCDHGEVRVQGDEEHEDKECTLPACVEKYQEEFREEKKRWAANREKTAGGRIHLKRRRRP